MCSPLNETAVLMKSRAPPSLANERMLLSLPVEPIHAYTSTVFAYTFTVFIYAATGGAKPTPASWCRIHPRRTRYAIDGAACTTGHAVAQAGRACKE